MFQENKVASLIIFTILVFLITGCAKREFVESEELRGSDKPKDYGKITYYPSYQTLHQAVNASEYVVKGVPRRIVYINGKTDAYSYEPCGDKCADNPFRSIIDILGVEVEFIELLYNKYKNVGSVKKEGPKEGSKSINWNGETFLISFPKDLSRKKQITAQDIHNEYINNPFYFLCSIYRNNYYKGKNGEKYKCNILSQPPILPVSVSKKDEIMNAINQVQIGVKPEPESCKFRNPPYDNKTHVRCP